MGTGTVSNSSYSLATSESEDGVTETTPVPNRLGASAYYNDKDGTVSIIGGNDGTNTYANAYELDLSENTVSYRASAATSYGYMRVSSKFEGVEGNKYSVTIAVRNEDAISDLKNPYIRLTVLIGPLDALQRKVRSQYITPPQDQFGVFSLAFELGAGETEFRVYLRHYGHDTHVGIKDFQIVDSNTNGLLIPGGKLHAAKYDEILDRRNCSGVFRPFFGSQLTVNQEIFKMGITNSTTNVIALVFSSKPTANKETPTGEFKLVYIKSGVGYEETLLSDVELNHARNFSSHRGDIVHSKFFHTDTEAVFEVRTYNRKGLKTFNISKPLTIHSLTMDKANIVHSLLL